jgi:hypothetical protein
VTSQSTRRPVGGELDLVVVLMDGLDLLVGGGGGAHDFGDGCERSALRKLAMLDAAEDLKDVRTPPENRQEALKSGGSASCGQRQVPRTSRSGAAAASLAHVLGRVGHPNVAIDDGGLVEWCADRSLPLQTRPLA